MKKGLSFLIILALLLQVLPTRMIQAAEVANASDYIFNILEIQPGRNFELTHTWLADSNLNSDKVRVTRYSVSEYIALRDDLIGKYDIIYVGNNGAYSSIGAAATKLPHNGKENGFNDKGTRYYENYSAVDLTNLKAALFKEFINNNNVVVFNESIFKDASNDYKNTKLYKNFVSYYNNKNKNNVIFNADPTLFISGIASSVTNYSVYGTLRPYLKLTQQPKTFDGTIGSYETTGIINYKYDIKSFVSENATFTISLFFDINGDGYYKASDDELLDKRVHVNSNNNLITSIIIPESFTGLQPWKLEVKNESTGATNYILGNTAFKGKNPIEVNVLQVYPNGGGTFNLKTQLKDENNKNLLDAFADDYVITVDSIDINSFTKLYNDSSTFSMLNHKNANGKNYNMIIYGFADVYGHADIKNERIANDIKSFIATGQSVMFTHDNLTFRTFDTNGWSYGITKFFRDYVGQNIYKTADNPYGDPQPAANGNKSFSHGFSTQALIRAENGNFTTTRQVKKFNDGLLTNFPYALGDIQVAPTHYQYFQLNLEDPDVLVWYVLKGRGQDEYSPQNYYYTYSKGNITYSGTGHSDLSSSNNISFDERRLFVNTMIKAIRGSNFAPSVQIAGITSGENISMERKKQTITITATDPDINDRLLHGQVFVDLNGDGIYQASERVKTYTIADGNPLINGEPMTLELDLSSIQESVTQLRIKVIVNDGRDLESGAFSSAETVNPRVNMPVIDGVIAAHSMLVGETQTVTLGLNLRGVSTTQEILIKNIGVTHKFFDGASHTAALLPINTKIGVSQTGSDWSMETNQMTIDGISDIPVTTSTTWDRNYRMHLYANKAGTYYLQSQINYYLDLLASTQSQTAGTPLNVYKGLLNITLVEDTGASLVQDIPATLYRVKDKNGLDITPVEIAKFTIPAGSAYQFGDTDDEILIGGSYELHTESVTGYDSAQSSIIQIEATETGSKRNLEVIIPSKPIMNVTLSHLDAVNYLPEIVNATNTRYLKASAFGYWELKFDVTKQLKEFQLTLTDSYGLDTSMVKVLNSDDVDVSSQFTYDATTKTITGKNLAGIDVSTYRIIFQSKYPNINVKHGDRADINVRLELPVIAMNDVELDYLIGKPVSLKFAFIHNLTDLIL